MKSLTCSLRVHPGLRCCRLHRHRHALPCVGHHGVRHQLHDGSHLPRHVGHGPGRLLGQRGPTCASLVGRLVGPALVPGRGLLRLRLWLRLWGDLRWVSCLWLLWRPLLLPLLRPGHDGHLVHLQQVRHGDTSDCLHPACTRQAAEA